MTSDSLSSFYADVDSDFIKLDGDTYYRVPENKAPITVSTSQVVTGSWESCYIAQLDAGTAGNTVTGFTGIVSGANGFYAPDGNVFNKRATFTNNNGWFQWWDGDNWFLSNVPYTTGDGAQWTMNGSGDSPGLFGNIETFLTEPAVSNQKTLIVDSQRGFNAGDTIFINPDNIGASNTEAGIISEFGSIILKESLINDHYKDEVVRKTVPTSTLFQNQSSNTVPVNGFDIGLGNNFFGGSVEGANGNYIPTGEMINGRNTFTNGDGWYMFWNGNKWILTDTPYSVEPSAVVSGFTGAVSGANGKFKPGNEKQNGKSTYKNDDGWLIYWDEVKGKWILTNIAYISEPPAKWIANGTGDFPGAFDYTLGGSSHFLNQTGSSVSTPAEWIGNGAGLTPGTFDSNTGGSSSGFSGQGANAETDTGITLDGYTGAVSGANGDFTADGNTENGKPTYSNGNGWYMYWDGDNWILTDTPYTTNPPAEWVANGDGGSPGTFNPLSGSSDDFEGQGPNPVTPTQTSTPTQTPTNTPTQTQTQTPTQTPTQTQTPSITPSSTPLVFQNPSAGQSNWYPEGPPQNPGGNSEWWSIQTTFFGQPSALVIGHGETDEITGSSEPDPWDMDDVLGWGGLVPNPIAPVGSPKSPPHQVGTALSAHPGASITDNGDGSHTFNIIITDNSNSGLFYVFYDIDTGHLSQPYDANWTQHQFPDFTQTPTPTPTQTVTPSPSMVLDYNLSFSPATVNEGDITTITCQTSNVADGTVLPYTITGVDASDINASLQGSFTISNPNGATGIGSDSFQITITNDLATEGTETMQLDLDNGLAAPAMVQINDTSINQTATITGPSTANEGDSILLNIATVGITDGTSIDYTWTDIDANDITPHTGSITITNNAGSITFTLTEDWTTEGTESATFNITAPAALAGVTHSVDVLDTSIGSQTLAGTAGFQSHNILGFNFTQSPAVPAGKATYHYEISTASDFSSIEQTETSATFKAEHQFTGLTPYTTYYARVRATGLVTGESTGVSHLSNPCTSYSANRTVSNGAYTLDITANPNVGVIVTEELPGQSIRGLVRPLADDEDGNLWLALGEGAFRTPNTSPGGKILFDTGWPKWISYIPTEITNYGGGTWWANNPTEGGVEAWTLAHKALLDGGTSVYDSAFPGQVGFLNNAINYLSRSDNPTGKVLYINDYKNGSGLGTTYSYYAAQKFIKVFEDITEHTGRTFEEFVGSDHSGEGNAWVHGPALETQFADKAAWLNYLNGYDLVIYVGVEKPGYLPQHMVDAFYDYYDGGGGLFVSCDHDFSHGTVNQIVEHYGILLADTVAGGTNRTPSDNAYKISTILGNTAYLPDGAHPLFTNIPTTASIHAGSSEGSILYNDGSSVHLPNATPTSITSSYVTDANGDLSVTNHTDTSTTLLGNGKLIVSTANDCGGTVDPYTTPGQFFLDHSFETGEGSAVTITLKHYGATQGDVIPYTITGVANTDITNSVGNNVLTGSFTVNNTTTEDLNGVSYDYGEQTTVINILEDSTTEGNETLTLTLDDVPTNPSVSFLIDDFSRDPGDVYVANDLANVAAIMDSPDMDIDLADIFHDSDEADNTYANISKTAVSSDPSIAGVTVANDTLTLQFVEDAVGETTVTVTGTSSDSTATDTFLVTVTELAPGATNTFNDLGLTQSPEADIPGSSNFTPPTESTGDTSDSGVVQIGKFNEELKFESPVKMGGFTTETSFNGTFEPGDVDGNGNRTFNSSTGCQIYYDTELGKWVITDTPGSRTGNWMANGTDPNVTPEAPGFNPSNGSSTGSMESETGTTTDNTLDSGIPGNTVGDANGGYATLNGVTISGLYGAAAGANGYYAPSKRSIPGTGSRLSYYKPGSTDYFIYWNDIQTAPNDPTHNPGMWILTDVAYSNEAPANWLGGCNTTPTPDCFACVPGNNGCLNGGSASWSDVGTATCVSENKTENGRATYSNGNGWFVYWDGSTWIYTNTPFDKTGEWREDGTGTTPTAPDGLASGALQGQSAISSSALAGQLRTTLYFNSGATKSSASGPFTEFSDNEWYHMAMVRSQNTVTTYVNGVPVATLAQAEVGGGESMALIGALKSSSWQNDYCWNGKIDQPCVWQRPLSPQEIRDTYNSGHGVKYANWTNDFKTDLHYCLEFPNPVTSTGNSAAGTTSGNLNNLGAGGDAKIRIYNASGVNQYTQPGGIVSPHAYTPCWVPELGSVPGETAADKNAAMTALKGSTGTSTTVVGNRPRSSLVIPTVASGSALGFDNNSEWTVQLWLLRKGEARGYGMVGKIHAGQGSWTGNNTTYSHVYNAAGYLVSEYAGHSNGNYNSNLGMSAVSNPNASYPLWNLS
jgi:hypothetical protein